MKTSNNKFKKETFFKLYKSIVQLEEISIYQKIILSYYTWISNNKKFESKLSYNKLSIKLGMSRNIVSYNIKILIEKNYLQSEESNLIPTNRVIINENEFYSLFYYNLQLKIKPVSKLVLTYILSFTNSSLECFSTNETIQSELSLDYKSVSRALKELDDNEIIKRTSIEESSNVFYYRRNIEINREGLLKYNKKVIVDIPKKIKVQEKAPVEPQEVIEEVKVIVEKPFEEDDLDILDVEEVFEFAFEPYNYNPRVNTMFKDFQNMYNTPSKLSSNDLFSLIEERKMRIMCNSNYKLTSDIINTIKDNIVDKYLQHRILNF